MPSYSTTTVTADRGDGLAGRARTPILARLRGTARRAADPVVWSSAVLFGRGGLSEDARNLILALDWLGVPVFANPLKWAWGTDITAASSGRLNSLIPLALPARFVHVMQMAPPAFQRHPAAVRHIGRVTVETETAPARWIPACEAADELWVSSRFAMAALVRAGLSREKIFVIPECLPVDLYHPDVRPMELERLGVPTGMFVFLSVIGWTRRKGWDVLVRAFVEEFGSDEAVTLLLKVSPYFGRSVQDGVAELQRFFREQLRRDPRRCARVVVADIDPGVGGMPGLYRAANAYVMASRGEAWGRPYMEAMAMGLPTIGTRWGGNLDFMNEENSYLIDCDIVQPDDMARAERPALRDHWWAEPSVPHLRRLLRSVVERPDEAAARGARARADIVAACNWERIGSLVLDRLAVTGGVRDARPRASRPAFESAPKARHASRRDPDGRYPRIAEWEPWLWEYVPRSGRVAVDVGAHLGTYALDLAETFEEVHAFEPDPEVLRSLAIHAAARRNLRIWPCALGAAPGDLQLTIYSRHGHSSAYRNPAMDAVRGPGRQTIAVPVVTLDALGFAERRVDFVKVDVEGYEVQVLLGARETLARCRPRLLIEVHTAENQTAIREILGTAYDITAVRVAGVGFAGQCWFAAMPVAGARNRGQGGSSLNQR